MSVGVTIRAWVGFTFEKPSEAIAGLRLPCLARARGRVRIMRAAILLLALTSALGPIEDGVYFGLGVKASL